MTTEGSPLTGQQFSAAEGVEDWRVLGRTAAAWFSAPTHSAGAALVARLASLVGTGPLPDVDLRRSGVQIRLPRDEPGFDPAVLVLARAVSAAAGDLGLRPDPSVLQDVQLTFDASDPAALMPFWTTVLGYEPEGEEDTVDPWRRHPPIWWQDMDAPRPLRNRVHMDSVASQEVASAAVETVRSQGLGTVADHGYYATVADAEGNEVDILPLPAGADRWEGEDTSDWRLVFSAVACYRTTRPDEAVRLASEAARLADEAGLDLAVDLRDGLVVLDSGKDRWETEEGYEPLAARVQAAARGLGLSPRPELARFVQVGLDAVDIKAVRRFWQAVLAYDEDPREFVTDLVDPRGLGPVLFLQDLEPDTGRQAQRNRIHVDVFLPHDQARARLDAALAAGGTVVRDRSPFWWTVADPEGNEVDLSVAVGREEAWSGA